MKNLKENRKDFHFNSGKIEPRSSINTRYNEDELYDTKELAEERAFNIGCLGCRKVIVNANGSFKYSPCINIDEYKKIMKEISHYSLNRKYYSFDQTNNLRDIRETINDKVREGFNYKGQIFKKTMSNVIFRDPVKKSILDEIEKIFFGLIESVKQIKNYFNYTVPNNNKRVF